MDDAGGSDRGAAGVDDLRLKLVTTEGQTADAQLSTGYIAAGWGAVCQDLKAMPVHQRRVDEQADLDVAFGVTQAHIVCWGDDLELGIGSGRRLAGDGSVLGGRRLLNGQA